MVSRIIEVRLSEHAGQIITALLTKVSVSGDPNSHNVAVEWMHIGEVEKTLRDMGLTQEGRDQTRERDKLRKVLEMLSSHKEGILRKRTVQATAQHSASSASTRASSRRKASAAAVAANTAAVTTGSVEEWSLEWQSARKLLVQSLTSQLIRDQFGTLGLRMFNLLSDGDPPQRLEDNHIFATCMVTPQEGREILNEMVRRSIICWQEVPRSGNTPLVASFWLYYVDHQRLSSSLLWNVLHTILNLRIRFRLEMARGAPLESRIASLSKKERASLKEGRRMEDIIERAFLVLATALLDFQTA